jgi:phytoene synthase
MQDAFAYCADLVRAADRDRYIASLFAPAAHRGGLHALYAFNVEVSRVRDAAREPLPGEIRLQWWTDVLSGERSGEASANPVASALAATITRYQLDATRLMGVIEARRFDLYDEPMAGIADLETYANRTTSTIFALAARVLAGVDTDAFAGPAGVAYGITALLRALPQHAATGRIYLPSDVLVRHDVHTRDLYAGRSSPGLNAAVADLRHSASRHLSAARDGMNDVPAETIPAFLPIALVRPSLERLARSDPFAPAELPAWRRQWLIWRAARKPARIAG